MLGKYSTLTYTAGLFTFYFNTRSHQITHCDLELGMLNVSQNENIFEKCGLDLIREHQNEKKVIILESEIREQGEHYCSEDYSEWTYIWLWLWIVGFGVNKKRWIWRKKRKRRENFQGGLVLHEWRKQDIEGGRQSSWHKWNWIKWKSSSICWRKLHLNAWLESLNFIGNKMWGNLDIEKWQNQLYFMKICLHSNQCQKYFLERIIEETLKYRELPGSYFRIPRRGNQVLTGLITLGQERNIWIQPKMKYRLLLLTLVITKNPHCWRQENHGVYLETSFLLSRFHSSRT